MSTTFKEFLQEQAQKHQAEMYAAKATVDEWQDAVDRLFGQIKTWLKESDPNGLIQIKDSQEEIREPGLGIYLVPRLNLNAFGKWIGIIPKARKTIGAATPPQKSTPERAQGRVDITDELRRYVLYRFVDNGRDVWVIDGLERGPHEVDDRSWPGQVQHGRKPDTRPLDQEAFEKALMSYLR
ncbi:MAG: hypothetical protein U0793_30005 [Gemmataceae bacterium]